MKVIITRNGAGYLPEAQVLCRAYDNQGDNPPEDRQCVGDVLFRDGINLKPQFITALLPRGVAKGFAQALRKMRGDFTVQIANEFPPVVGVLTSCPENFLGAIKRELDDYGIPYEVQ